MMLSKDNDAIVFLNLKASGTANNSWDFFFCDITYGVGITLVVRGRSH